MNHKIPWIKRAVGGFHAVHAQSARRYCDSNVSFVGAIHYSRRINGDRNSAFRRWGIHGCRTVLTVIVFCWGVNGMAATFSVANRATTGPGSLDQAILDSNTSAGLDRIIFNIPGPGPHTILVPASGFAQITDPVEIDGYSQPGTETADFTQAADIRVALDGSAMNPSTVPLDFYTSGSSVRGLALHSSPDNPISLAGNNNHVVGCYLGTDVTGLNAMPNARGIFVGGNGNEIGGIVPAKRNVISGGSQGVYVAGDHNLVRGNYIGTDASGTQAIPNLESGVQLHGNNNQIGDLVEGGGNLISGNNQSGVYFSRGTRNIIVGNLIGTDTSGTLAIPNLVGVKISGDSTVNTVGGRTPEARNVISGNQADGIHMIARANLVQGNYIGTDISGQVALPNSRGVQINGKFNVIGGAVTGAGNVISGNTNEGVILSWAVSNWQAPTGNLIIGNAIGTDATRTVAVGNGGTGIHIQDVEHNVVGAVVPGGGNLIVANGGHGVALIAEGGQRTFGNLLFGNRIGILESDRFVDLGNGGDGIFMDGAENTTIGGELESMANIVAFNSGAGVAVESGVGNAILRSEVFGNDGLAIDLGNDGRTLNDAGDTDVAPKYRQRNRDNCQRNEQPDRPQHV